MKQSEAALEAQDSLDPYWHIRDPPGFQSPTGPDPVQVRREGGVRGPPAPRYPSIAVQAYLSRVLGPGAGAGAPWLKPPSREAIEAASALTPPA